MDCGDLKCDFAGNYEISALPAVKALEIDVLGSDYGGTSWTTKSQADDIIESLQLDERSRLLEVGSGSGWPGLYLARHSGCNVTLLDLPMIALKHAADRATSDNISNQVSLVNSDASAMPFDDAAFPAISHSDVLCCLPQKLEVLQECRRVASSGARMQFTVIEPTEGLSEEDYQKVLETGPPFIGLDGTYPELLIKSGWRLDERIDVTEEYGDSLERLAEGLNHNDDSLRDAYSEDELNDLIQHRRNQAHFVRTGKIARFAYLATAI